MKAETKFRTILFALCAFALSAVFAAALIDPAPSASAKTKTERMLGEPLNEFAVDENGWTHLHWAAAANDVESVQRLLDMGAASDFSSKGSLYRFSTPEQNLLRLLESPVWGRQEGRTPLMVAASFNYSIVVSILIASGADVNAKSVIGQTPLHYATQFLRHTNDRGVFKTAELLINNGADVEAQDEDGFAPLHHAARNGMSKTAELLISNGADVNVKYKDGSTPLLYAAGEGMSKTAELLINNGADVNARGKRGSMPLHMAAVSQVSKVVELLINNGAEINAKTANGETPLHGVAGRSYTIPRKKGQTGGYVFEREENSTEIRKIVELLIDNGADVNAKTSTLETPLHRAADSISRGQLRWDRPYQAAPEIMELLINNGAVVNAKAISGSTPLHYAAGKGLHENVELLINNGADVNAKNNYGITPLDMAETAGGKTQVLLQRNGGKRASQLSGE